LSKQAGDAALQLAKSKSFNLVLTDVNMPKMDGITLPREFRALPAYKKQEGKAAGATGWLVKPFNPEQLISTVKRVLG